MKITILKSFLNCYPLLEQLFMIRNVGMKLAVGLPSSRPRGWLGLTAALGLTLLGFGGCGDPNAVHPDEDLPRQGKGPPR